MTLCIFNNDWAELDKLHIPIVSESVQYGLGLFETMRTYADKSMPFLDQHLIRFYDSVEALNLTCPYTQSQLREMIMRLVAKSPHEYQRVKLLLLKEGVLITSFQLQNQVSNPVTLTHWQAKRSLAQHKTTSYLDCHLAWQFAQAGGYDDSILVDESGWVSETGRANLFWVKHGSIFTTEDGVLPGIIRGLLLNGEIIDCQFGRIKLVDLYQCDEVFITNSIRGIVSVNAIDDATFTTHTVTEQLQKQLHDFIADSSV